jgi:hypothetical protein
MRKCRLYAVKSKQWNIGNLLYCLHYFADPLLHCDSCLATGVDIVSCSTMPTAGSCDMMLVVVDRLDSQPLDDCLKQSVRQGLRSVLQQSPSSHGHPKQQQQQQHSSLAPAGSLAAQQAGSSAPQMQQQQQQEQQQHVRQAAAVCVRSSSDSRAAPDLCRADSASEGIAGSRVGSRQLSSADTVQQPEQQLQQQAQQHQQQHSSSVGAVTGTHVPAAGSLAGPSLRHQVSLDPAGIAAAAPPSVGNTPPSIRPALKIDIPFEPSLMSMGLASAPVGNRQTKGRHAAQTSAAAATAGVEAQDLAQRLVQLGMRQQVSGSILNDDSSSEDERQGSGSGNSSSRARGSCDWQRWQGPLPLLGSSVGEVSVSSVLQQLRQQQQEQEQQQQDSFSFSSAEPTGRSSRRNSGNHSGAAATPSSSAAAAAGAGDDDLAFYAVDGQALDSKPERSGGSDNTLMQRRDADADGEMLVAPSPRVGSGRRRGPPPRTPSRIILSPVAPDGSEKLFVAIPKPSSEKRRLPVMRSATVSAAAAPSSAGRQSVLAALLRSQGNLGKFASTAASPKAAAAAAAAAGMPYNVAVAAAQLLGNSGSTRDAAAAAIAAAVANEQQQQQYPPSTPHRSPGFASAPCSAGSSAEALRSPVAATPRGGQVPLTPPTPVHPAVVAAAAAAIAAAAEAAGEEAAAAAAATAAAAREREVLAATGVSCTIAEEGEENSSVVESAGGDADAEDNGTGAEEDASDTGSSCSEEWWCGPLTGLTVRDIMTGPLQVVSADADVSVARQLMVQHNLPGILVDVGPGAEPGFLTRR